MNTHVGFHHSTERLVSLVVAALIAGAMLGVGSFMAQSVLPKGYTITIQQLQ